MLTIIAWIVFVFASIWNIFFWGVNVTYLVQGKSFDWDRGYVNCVKVIITLAIWIIPCVYLFGMF